MKRLAISTAVVLLCGTTAVALNFDSNAGLTERDGVYFLHTPLKTVAVQPLNNDIFRIYTLPKGTSDIIAPRTQATVLSVAPDSVSTYLSPTEFTLQSPTTIVRINRSSGQVSFENADGEPLLKEGSGVSNSGQKKTVSFTPMQGHSFYGAGERGHSLKLNGDTLGMYNYAIPRGRQRLWYIDRRL